MGDDPVQLFGKHPDGQENSWYNLNVSHLSPYMFGQIHCGFQIGPTERPEGSYDTFNNAMEAMDRLMREANK